MKKLIQDKNTILKDMLDGITVSNKDVEIVSDTIVVRKNEKQSGVALVSGGGSGHEPAHAGFVAQGMLDAAVCGEVFTSPTPDKILDAIKAVDNGDGVLLIIKNYAGDVMNFEMAQEMAQMEDIQVESVIVRDDIAISDPEKRRGVAGTVFVHKYAGYLAENGVALSEIKSKIEAILPEIKSIGMALTPPMVPTTGKNGFDIEDNEMEIGIGIHGEKGLHREAVQPVNTIVERLLDELFKEIDKQPLIVMVNGMGGTPLSELNIVTKYLDEQFKNNNIDVRHWFVGDYMTALDMQGFSITVLPFSEDVAKGLVAPTASKYF
ncbi:dihydroxyacetone kinase subunit DhaK [Staphylococcus saccharolyticus]|uniref:dihydroxyacetone kinase subunit DhaK n=1 Tax=Staphylococcus saccharolyticus TaxID=33028 RepID=UPI00102DA808|nr:dihydroxyacetone kinase subunit DhaK [Staphylococcus saccharolyticus]MBL7573890.1 dihydroxyacetone kinase subunit DhaK [Staphylococcus saccharolyticus]MBL7584893.1 dihydroxyacetone kinase subunit DhaK [Staphylococcus saccharolyticus]MBL7639185.1 dihydroxyacetone kinase subunit DhaK [Staphylococcus saccharolyticus]QRJ68512.1 dihydroxyacetone kinase subunit DhaK [Staphylococcus saccharolyticus]TAA91830.1 dihydroxyacetone kinase subunit DhaK [Staphylococcus saccharolyticus]